VLASHVICPTSTFIITITTNLPPRRPVPIWAPSFTSTVQAIGSLFFLIKSISYALSLGNVPRGIDRRQPKALFDAACPTGSRSLRTVSPLPRSWRDLTSRSAISHHHHRSRRSEVGDSPLREAFTKSRFSESEVHPGENLKCPRIPIGKRTIFAFQQYTFAYRLIPFPFDISIDVIIPYLFLFQSPCLPRLHFGSCLDFRMASCPRLHVDLH
jgi:hypothetical protein